ncbi:Fe(2+) transporter permease subunit FeoB [Snodgrassella sp. B3882]|uniref:Fe(2+) transporter permease subunit FeoB n=1 Tax=Snodgrassella sp. B3882 TaxID=2818037 RepID=UPI00226A1B4B|nr:Fe(2+) transporter permease subunit FeoB [Snodgrassella sp. B3882]MCX8744071.1 Fe(2+) transporter permease subunit FeoB [Snodgrassella sp. B3882]
MKIALIGNPNCGKSTLFNALTGARQHIGNWPGVTIERKTGSMHINNQSIDIVDLPGTYAIENLQIATSEDELIAREFVLNEPDSLIVNIIDATNLQRSLYLTFQLLDLQRPMIIVLNMMDALKNLGEQINIAKLTQQLGCPVVPISAAKKNGLDQLEQVLSEVIHNPILPNTQIATLGDKQTSIIHQHLAKLPADSFIHQLNQWSLIELLLNGATTQLTPAETSTLHQCQHDLSAWCNNEIDVALASARYEAIDQLCRQVIEKPREANISLSDKIDNLTLGRFTGIPCFLLMMYLMFMLAVKFGSVFTDFFDVLFATIFVDGFSYLLNSVHAPAWLTAILANGIGSGIQTVATFIPVIAAMFLCLSLLEDSGYLARAAMVVDRGMRAIGLPGKAFVPMLVGFGCGVPAIMGTRTLESTRDRLMSICMIPFMSCGARLPVYTLFATIFFPQNAATVVFSLYLLGIVIAIITGLILKHTLLPGAITPFIMELPAYRLPTLRGMLYLTWSRLKGFIFRAGQAIVVMVTILSLLNSIGTDGSFGHNNSDRSILAVTSKKITPVFQPMGINEHNWPATVGIFTGIFAKEAVIATLNSLYSMETEDSSNETFNFIEGVSKAFKTIPENLAKLKDSVLDPLGISAVNEDLASVQEELEISTGTVSKMEKSFSNNHAAMAYLIFILLYTPCAAALGTIYREAGWRWMLFVAGWTFFIGWTCATFYYQSYWISESKSAIYILGTISLLFILLITAMKMIGPRQPTLQRPSQHPNPDNCCH